VNKLRTPITPILDHLKPLDALETEAIATVRSWLSEGRPLYRTRRPDVPPQHLVAYCVVVDRARESVLLLEHLRSGLWLPAGGHVEVGEDPHQTAVRELAEELGPRAAMVASVAAMPLFITVTTTRGAGRHTDISLWYVVAGDEHMWLEPDPGEFAAHRWMTWRSVLEWPPSELDPGMLRFLHKLMGRIPA
jgi:8-oxo-dGTP pyrophosphatase MutT (NUDIX family)